MIFYFLLAKNKKARQENQRALLYWWVSKYRK